MYINKQSTIIVLEPQDIRESRKYINYMELKFEDFRIEMEEIALATMVIYRNGEQFRVLKSRY